MKNIKKVVGVLTLVVYGQVCGQVANWDNSPANWKNSESNWDNSPANWNNSPSNWNNSSSNWNATNGIYDNQGKRLGYEVQSPAGVTNVFDNNGNRIGYVPSK
ncbi:hypothetical protein [Polynucleobacter sp. MWH-HuK1]|uniref:hypothetical protein n=1 Tax=Polynucleobacter sp. MWH-HuK1 TaxID=1743158 RepID=UPI001C0B3B3D|nr:hypothetical protein [Polynucleobacter sp. MWH-HuK1]